MDITNIDPSVLSLILKARQFSVEQAVHMSETYGGSDIGEILSDAEAIFLFLQTGEAPVLVKIEPTTTPKYNPPWDMAGWSDWVDRGQ